MPEFEQGGVWRMKVKAATIDADAAAEAVIDPYTGQPYNGPATAGVQYTLVNLSLTHISRGAASASRFVIRNVQLAAHGVHSASYTPDVCVPPSPDLEALPNDNVVSGQTVTGNLCFVIASNDANTPLLRAVIDSDTANSGNTERTIWFALH